jgi:hypothetical protein
MTELEDGFAIVRSLLDGLESRADQEPELVRGTIVKLIAVLRAHGRPPKKAGNRPRGYGYTFDEAQIMASLPDYGGSIEKAARAHWKGMREDQVEANIRTLHRHRREIEDFGLDDFC